MGPSSMAHLRDHSIFFSGPSGVSPGKWGQIESNFLGEIHRKILKGMRQTQQTHRSTEMRPESRQTETDALEMGRTSHYKKDPNSQSHTHLKLQQTLSLKTFRNHPGCFSA